jgi:Protein of unknown function (DUF3040)
MDSSRERITLTNEERRLLAELEKQARHFHPELARSLTVGSPTWRARLRSHRVGDIAAIVVFSVGVALMLATFARWPIIASVGVVLQVMALTVGLARWAPRVGAAFRRWTQDRR